MQKQIWIPHDISLTGTHARLEPLQHEHSDALAVAAGDGELWNLEVSYIPTAAEMPNWVAEAISNREAHRELPFVVRRLSDQTIVGMTRYYLLAAENRNLSIGYTWYAKSAQRTAINTECKFLLLNYAFETLHCISVAWHIDSINTVSQTAVKRLGATYEGTLRNAKIMPSGRIRHTQCYSMLDSEWPAAKDNLLKKLDQHA